MNLNIGCIETKLGKSANLQIFLMNLNIGCIETRHPLRYLLCAGRMNLNIGCIETLIALGICFHIFADEPQHWMY